MGLRAVVERTDGEPEREVRIGDQVRYRFGSDRDAWLTVIHIDSFGVATVLYPSRVDPESRLKGGVDREFPAELTIEPPLGLEDLFAFATPEPVTAKDLHLDFATGPVSIWEADQSPLLAERLRDRLAAFDPGEIAITRVSQRIHGRGDVQYNKDDIVAYFTTRTRSLKRPKLDLEIQFATNSAELDARARANLDEIGSALSAQELSEERFVVSGHTDDVGDDQYNMELSGKRAESVRAYLRDQHGIESQRLETEALGESRPKESGTNTDARRANRRVEFELSR